MIGYRNACYNPKDQTVEIYTWSDDGDRISYTTKYYPYYYYEDKRGHEVSIYNTPLAKKSFNNAYERQKYLTETGIRRVYEHFGSVQQALLDIFWEHNETEDFSKFPIKTYFVDIEAVCKDRFPDPALADVPINVLTIYDSFSKKFYAWGLKPYKAKRNDVVYYYCKSEEDLLSGVIEFFKNDPPDVLSGWNSAGFDIPYIINRLKNVFGEAGMHEISPVKRTYVRTFIGTFGKTQASYHIDGISCVDYLDVYKRFSFANRESYKLDSIGELELGEKKVVLEKDLYDVMVEDWDKFIDYNIQDVNILVKLEEKLQFLSLIRMISYIGCTTFEGALGTLGIITGAACIRARKKGQRISTFIRKEDDGSRNPGAYVAEPLNGFQEDIVSFDANSLYPNLMISLNMSPETKVGKIVDMTEDTVTVHHVNGQTFKLSKPNFAHFLKKEDIAISKAKVLFSQKNKGIVPEMVDFYYQKRKVVQTELKKYKKEYANKELTVDRKLFLETKITQLNAKQQSIKIFINSCYGYFGNKHAPIGDDDIASSITLTGQAVIKQARDIAKIYISKHSNITDAKTLETVAIYGDTDSCYLSLKLLPIDFSKNGKITKEGYDHAENLEKFLNEQIQIWAKNTLNSKDCRLAFKREAMADVGLFLEKKRYVLHVLDDEGIQCDKWKYTGVDVVRTSMPKNVKPYVKKIIETMLTTKSCVKTNEVLKEAYDVFQALPLEDVSRTSGIKGYEKYANMCHDFRVSKGMPNHVKAAYFHNVLLEKMNLTGKYEKIASGDKIKYFYVQVPNKYGIESIGFKYIFPEEFKAIFQPDRELLFEKIVYAAVERFYQCVNWTPRKPSEQVVFELDDLFGE
jgi:DNA polymerase elongation subunit (family B)